MIRPTGSVSILFDCCEIVFAYTPRVMQAYKHMLYEKTLSTFSAFSVDGSCKRLRYCTKIVKVKVSQDDGAALSGVSVQVKGSKTSTSTDAEGMYGFSVSKVKVHGDTVLVRVYSSSAVDEQATTIIVKDAKGNRVASMPITALKAPPDLLPIWASYKNQCAGKHRSQQ